MRIEKCVPLLLMNTLFITVLFFPQISFSLPDNASYIILSFDDNVQQRSYDTSVRVMDEFGYRGVAFLVAGWTSNFDVWRNLLIKGWEIGCHSWSHPRLDRLSLGTLKHELIDSKLWLEEAFGLSIISFAYPFSRGSDNSTVHQVLSEAGYLYAREGGWHKDWDGSRSYQVNSYCCGQDGVNDPSVYYEQNIQKAIYDSKKNGISVVMFHRVMDVPYEWDPYALSTNQFRHCLQKIKDNGLEVVTFKDLEKIEHTQSIFFNFVPNPATPGSSVTLKGMLVDDSSNPITYAKVKVEYSIDNGESWNHIWTLSTNDFGIFSKTFSAPGFGRYLTKVSYTGDSSHMPSSNSAYLIARSGACEAEGSIFFNFNSNPATSGASVTLKGILLDEFGQSIAAEDVIVDYSFNHGETWHYIWTLSTNIYGVFSQTFTVSSTGAYLVRISHGRSKVTTYLIVS